MSTFGSSQRCYLVRYFVQLVQYTPVNIIFPVINISERKLAFCLALLNTAFAKRYGVVRWQDPYWTKGGTVLN